VAPYSWLSEGIAVWSIWQYDWYEDSLYGEEAQKNKSNGRAAQAWDSKICIGKVGAPAMEEIEQQFKWSVQALAQPADVQPRLFPSFVVVADELALDFDNWWRASESNFGNAWSLEQRRAVLALDQLLAEMSGSDKPELWLEKGCLNHPKWSEVRKLAREVLFAFGWSPGIPPLGCAIYMQCSPETKSQWETETGDVQ
jgi:hypothetical protein